MRQEGIMFLVMALFFAVGGCMELRFGGSPVVGSLAVAAAVASAYFGGRQR